MVNHGTSLAPRFFSLVFSSKPCVPLCRGKRDEARVKHPIGSSSKLLPDDMVEILGDDSVFICVYAGYFADDKPGYVPKKNPRR